MISQTERLALLALLSGGCFSEHLISRDWEIPSTGIVEQGFTALSTDVGENYCISETAWQGSFTLEEQLFQVVKWWIDAPARKAVGVSTALKATPVDAVQPITTLLTSCKLVQLFAERIIGCRSSDSIELCT